MNDSVFRKLQAMPMKYRLLLLLGILTCLPWMAANANLVSNPSFALDDASQGAVLAPTDWTVSGDAGVDNSLPFDGTGNDAFLGIGTLSQVLSTQPSGVYTISFVLAADQTTISDSNSSMNVTFDGIDLLNGTPIGGINQPGPYQYEQFSFQAQATDAASLLAFSAYTTGDMGTWYVTNVDVETAIPEPISFDLLVCLEMVCLCLRIPFRNRTVTT